MASNSAVDHASDSEAPPLPPPLSSPPADYVLSGPTLSASQGRLPLVLVDGETARINRAQPQPSGAEAHAAFVDGTNCYGAPKLTRQGEGLARQTGMAPSIMRNHSQWEGVALDEGNQQPSRTINGLSSMGEPSNGVVAARRAGPPGEGVRDPQHQRPREAASRRLPAHARPFAVRRRPAAHASPPA
ncbi:hypothetical protein B0H67DRAFT_614017 [Lasiosphaeris hirsuta]|uniref:Uncharacterized protein n=1 Tax=Lasiosphaeris hirsuta TaxID=260670 RepID=A0AA40DGV5_9PEZI|nr:hypothetical protein B0H67DRAFT_614017 [Lasiosphaeris hirsuta]